MNYDEKWLTECTISNQDVEKIANDVKQISESVSNDEMSRLLDAVSCIDLTSLNATDTSAVIDKLCSKAVQPLPPDLIKSLIKTGKVWQRGDLSKLTTAAVCVYPLRVSDAVRHLKDLKADLPVASVAAGFPTGLYPLHTRLQEIEYCVENGAREIDIVLDRSLILEGKWSVVYDEVKAMKKACGEAHLKAILSAGECGSLQNVMKASLICIMAGADFIKTSTGKETVNATLPFGIVMCRAIKYCYNKTGRVIGLKPAGGLKTSQDALQWINLVKSELGEEWLNPNTFRIGASSLLDDIVKRLTTLTGEMDKK